MLILTLFHGFLHNKAPRLNRRASGAEGEKILKTAVSA